MKMFIPSRLSGSKNAICYALVVPVRILIVSLQSILAEKSLRWLDISRAGFDTSGDTVSDTQRASFFTKSSIVGADRTCWS